MERAGSLRADFLLCHRSQLCPPGTISTMSVSPAGCPCQSSASLRLVLSVSASPSAVPTFHPSPVWSLFLHKDCHACPKMTCSVPGLPDLPGPAAKTHLGEPLPLKSKSPEERDCSACIRCPHLVPLAIEACGSHRCAGKREDHSKGDTGSISTSECVCRSFGRHPDILL